MDSLILSDRGTLTVPAKLRKALGLKSGSLLQAEARDGMLILHPAQLVRFTVYDEAKVKRVLAATKPDPSVAATLLKKARSRKRAA